MQGLEIRLFPCLNDNYGVLIHDSEAGLTASIDAPEPMSISAFDMEKFTPTNTLARFSRAPRMPLETIDNRPLTGVSPKSLSSK